MVVAWWPDSPVRVQPGGLRGGERSLGILFLTLEAAAFGAYLVGLLLLRLRAAPLRAVLAVAVAVQLAPLAAPLLLSTDAWAYWAYARVENPYRDPPRTDPLSAQYAGKAWLDTTSVYGPAFSLSAEPVGETGSDAGAAWTFKAIAAAALVAITLLVARVARRPAYAAALVGWNPLFAVHFAGGGHNDALMAALLAAALALSALGHLRGAGACWSLAILVKWIPVLFLPLRALEARATGRRLDHVGFAVTTAVVLILATWRYGFSWLHAVVPIAHNAATETRFSLPHRTGLPWWLFAAAFAVAYVWLLRAAARGRARLALCACLLLLTTPYLTAWYTIWALPLAAIEDDRTAQAIVLALCVYLMPQTIVL